MLLSKAIEQLEDAGKDRWCPWSQDLKDAIKLGIEALKEISSQRLFPHSELRPKLPGETPENEK